MSEEEQRTRAMMEPRETPRGNSIDGDSVSLDVGDPLVV